MTVCIAAASENGKKIIVLTDRMVVAGQLGAAGTVQRSGKATKSVECTPTCLLLHSGIHECVHWVAKKLREWTVTCEIVTIEMIYKQLKEEAQELTTEMRDRYIKANLGYNMDYSELSKALAGGALNLQFNHWQKAQDYINSGEFLLAGVDSSGSEPVGSIYSVSSTLGSTSFSITDKVDTFATIGCGGSHSREVLEAYDYDSDWDLPNALYAVYCAKRAAELSPGVDKECDLRIISSAGIMDANGTILHALKETYEAEWAERKLSGAYPSISHALQEQVPAGG
jgi:hypothetical protein